MPKSKSRGRSASPARRSGQSKKEKLAAIMAKLEDLQAESSSSESEPEPEEELAYEPKRIRGGRAPIATWKPADKAALIQRALVSPRNVPARALMGSAQVMDLLYNVNDHFKEAEEAEEALNNGKKEISVRGIIFFCGLACVHPALFWFGIFCWACWAFGGKESSVYDAKASELQDQRDMTLFLGQADVPPWANHTEMMAHPSVQQAVRERQHQADLQHAAAEAQKNRDAALTAAFLVTSAISNNRRR